MKKILLLLTFLFIVTGLSAQTGGKKREHKNQRGKGKFLLFSKSKGNAHKFARGGVRKKSFLARIFSGEKITAGGWIYHKTPGSHRDDHSLFHRYRAKNKVFRDKLQAKINKQRAKNRKRGNDYFYKRKY